MAQRSEKLEQAVLDKIVKYQSDANQIIFELGQVSLQIRELELQLKKINEIKTTSEEKFDNIGLQLENILSDLQTKQFKQVMMKILGLIQNPYPNDSIKLKGYEHYNRVDSGEFRVIYTIERDDLKIELVGKRNDDEVYKKLKNL